MNNNPRIKVQILPSRSGKTWSVWVDDMCVIRSTREPLVELAELMLAAGHKPDARIWMTRTPDGRTGRSTSTLGAAAMADATGLRFCEPEWRNLNPLN